MSRPVFQAADLFAGAGGASTGLLRAATSRGQSVELVAVNHWPQAVETHTANHPQVRHFCAPVETLDPRVAIPGGKLDLLIAAPECTHHSTARGGKPINDQSRASAWHILRWVELLKVRAVLIENVPEFQTWGPIGQTGRPLKARKGETFKAFVAALESYGYRVEWKVLNAADYGAATTRRRLFIVAQRGTSAPAWPIATHSKTGAPTLFAGPRKWRAAREVIDWTLPSQSIFARKRPLKPATMRRILEGLRRFGGPQLEPFLVVLRNNQAGASLDEPVATICANGAHHGLAEPCLVQLTHGGRTRSIDSPMPTVTTANRGEIGVVEPFIVQPAHGSGGGRGDSGRVASVDAPLGTQPASNRFALAEPFIVPFRSDSDGRKPRVKDINDPLHTITTENPIGLAEPFLVPFYSENGAQAPRVHSVDEPVPVIPSSGDGKFAVVEPFVLQQQSGGVPRKTDDPMPTVAAGGAISLVEPFIVPPRHMGGDTKVDSVDQPLRTVTAVAGHTFGVAEPFLTKYNGTAVKAKSVEEPLETVTAKDRFGLVQPIVNGYVLDIRFRMLQPHELAGAMSFPKTYVFTGNKGDQIRQIGNAIDCSMAEALCGAILDGQAAGKRPTRRREVA